MLINVYLCIPWITPKVITPRTHRTTLVYNSVLGFLSGFSSSLHKIGVYCVWGGLLMYLLMEWIPSHWVLLDGTGRTLLGTGPPQSHQPSKVTHPPSCSILLVTWLSQDLGSLDTLWSDSLAILLKRQACTARLALFFLTVSLFCNIWKIMRGKMILFSLTFVLITVQNKLSYCFFVSFIELSFI